MRLGVVGASIGTDVVGDVLRRLGGEESIGRVYYRLTILRRICIVGVAFGGILTPAQVGWC